MPKSDITPPDDVDQAVSKLDRAWYADHEPPRMGNGNGEDPPVSATIGERIARLEASQAGFWMTLTVVSATLLGGMALLYTAALDVKEEVDDLGNRFDVLESQVEALPGRISAELREVNRTLSEAITAARSSEQPTVIVIERGSGPSIYDPNQPLVND